MIRKISPLFDLYAMKWHEAVLWGAVTMSRKFNPDVSTREIIRAYKEELDIPDERLPEDSGWSMFCRMNNKVNRCRDAMRETPHKFQSEITQDIKDISDRLDALIQSMEKR